MECHIVEALLKKYKYGITSNETNQDIAEHLKECKACQMKFDELEIECKQENKKQYIKRNSYFPKIRKVMKIILIIIAVIGWVIILGVLAIIISVRMQIGG